jgi:hypothetical protein
MAARAANTAAPPPPAGEEREREEPKQLKIVQVMPQAVKGYI